MSQQPSRRALLAVRAVKATATTAVAGLAVVLTLSGALANAPQPAEELPGAVDASARLAEQIGRDARCADSPGRTIVRTPTGATKAVSFKQGWKVYRGERPGSIVVVCPD